MIPGFISITYQAIIDCGGRHHRPSVFPCSLQSRLYSGDSESNGPAASQCSEMILVQHCSSDVTLSTSSWLWRLLRIPTRTYPWFWRGKVWSFYPEKWGWGFSSTW
ncbi:hypothetical protein SLEP1_g21263 [Rubroshorea leprosula]|uniref:Uncharacterized protein n=1 Tax=Rubroshorea leprosula TaxID=152421 RepID=A0AAV5JBF1_9ROSI|nr:hypothetical protein SLEP1_g21263 [Rubroshorea leprosula]